MQTANGGRTAVLNEDPMERVETVLAAFAVLGSGFEGAVSFGVAADLSFGDVARTLRELVPGRYGEPVSIDCTRTNMPSAASGG